MEPIQSRLNRVKKAVFEFLFVLHHNFINSKHLLIIIQFLEMFQLVYFYINPLYEQLHRFKMFSFFFDKIWPQSFIFIKSQQFLLPLTMLLPFPVILITILMMKLIVGYQYLIIITIEIWFLLYPVLFIKYGIQTVNLIVGFPNYRAIGILAALIHTIGSIMVLHAYKKLYKMMDIFLIVFIQASANQYIILAITVVRLFVGYFIAPETLIKPLRFRLQISLLLVIIFSFFASDLLTNYISFILIVGVYVLTELVSIIRNYHQHKSIFYHLQNIGEDEPTSRLQYYEFVENHRISCENMMCMCRQLIHYKNDDEIKKKGKQFLQKIYSFKEDLHSRIELGQICCQHYEYTMKGILPLFQLQPQSIYEEYLLYYMKTQYEQEYRKQDKNYTFGQQYHNFYEDLRRFQEMLESTTQIMKEFWQIILNFDGSKKFLSLIIRISEQITLIKQKYVEYIDKYEEFSINFQYLYKTFEISILNSLDRELNQTNFGINKLQTQIKVPQKLLFFISNSDLKIVNCNRQFCNLVEFNKDQLINKKYTEFVPQTCRNQHSIWVQNWYLNFNREQQRKENIKSIKLSNQYTKTIAMQNKILPRFQKGVEVITFIKLVNNLENHSLNKQTNDLNQQNKAQSDEFNCKNFFSFLFQRDTRKITGIDDSFFYTIMIDVSEDLKKKILSLKINDLFPKIFIRKESSVQNCITHESHGQTLLNFSFLQQFAKKKQKSMSSNTIASTFEQNNFIKLESIVNNQLGEQNTLLAKKNRRKLSNVSAINPQIKQSNDQIFLYQIIQQKNIGLQTKYSIINFKLKKNFSFEVQTKKKEQTKFKNQIKCKDQIKCSESKFQQISEQDQQKSSLIMKSSEEQKQAVVAALSSREPFVRFSKPYKEENKEQQIEASKKAKLEQSQEFSEEQKNYCLPWPILIPLVVTHIIYMNITKSYDSAFVYLQQTFNFYDKYEMQIMRQINIPFDFSSSSIQDLKSLWIQGYGFYHDSFLIFENPLDAYFKNKLYQDVIKKYHYGIYQQISNSMDFKINAQQYLYFALFAIPVCFIIYIIIDFAFNLNYCIKISRQVTEIVLIFLNISNNDIQNFILNINQYQTQILEMVNFAEIQKKKKFEKQCYKLFNLNANQIAEISGISLLKEDYNNLFQTQFKNTDVLVTIDELQKQKNNNLIDSHQNLASSNEPSQLFPILLDKIHERNSFSNGTSNLRSKQNHRHRQRISILSNFTLQGPQSKNRKSNFSNKLQPIKQSNDLLNGDFQKRLSKASFEITEANINQSIIQSQNLQKSELEPQKIKKISNFKNKFRGKLNDVHQNPRSYIFIFVVLIVTVGVLASELILISQFLGNYKTFLNVYFDLRKLKIVSFNQLIEKVTQIDLLPDVKTSFCNQDFNFIVQKQLNALSQFQKFWAIVQSSDVCPIISDLKIQAQCRGVSNFMTLYGQKILFQYMEDILRRKNSTFFFEKSQEATTFMLIAKIQAALLAQGQTKMSSEIKKYFQKVGNLELIITITGTIVFFICILITRKALKDIQIKIKDGENLLLVMPQNIKKKYMEKIKNKRIKQRTKNYSQKKENEKQKKSKTKKTDSRIERQENGVELVPSSSFMQQSKQQMAKRLPRKN